MTRNKRAKYDAFLSYSNKDADFVRHLTDALSKEHVRFWYDAGALRVGDSILRNIEDALEQSRYFVLVISPEYLSSQWSNFEMGVALGRGLPILPVFAQEVQTSALPPQIARVHALHAKDMPVESIASQLAALIKEGRETPETGGR